ncbi:MAG TPA: tetratricopeptide repeat protein [Patescibacteria group bacterium]|nr:tetratricopeptide repeat protein [Patescibacteria group bacterium]
MAIFLRSVAAFAVLQALLLAAPGTLSSPTKALSPESCMACADSCDLDACHRIAIDLATTRDYTRAIAVEERVLALRPRDPDVAAALAKMVQMGTHDTARVVRLYHEALYSAPGYPPALLGLGLVMKDQGEMAIAERYFARGARENPGQPLFKVRLAEVLIASGRTDEARPILQEIVSQWPGSGEADEASRMIPRTSLARP